MEQFRELILLLESYHADEQITFEGSNCVRSLSSHASNVLPSVDPLFVHEDGSSTPNAAIGEGLSTCWNILPFLDITQEETQDYNRVAYLCWQRLAVLKTLASVGAIKAMPEIALQVLQTAKEYEFTTIVIETATQLRQFSALHEGSQKKFEQYQVLIQQYETILKAEQAAEREYLRFLMQQPQTGGDAKMLAALAREACDRLQTYTALCPTSLFWLNYYFLQLQWVFFSGQWAEVIEISIQAGKLLGRHNHFCQAKLSMFFLTKALGLANLGRLPDALEALSEAIAIEPEHSLNWYRLQETKLTWLIHGKQYAAALELVKSFNTDKNKWEPSSQRLFNTVLLYIAQNELVNIPSRVKGILALNQYSLKSQTILEANELGLDTQATLSLLQLPEWVNSQHLPKLIEWLKQYLQWTNAPPIHASRLTTLISCLNAISKREDFHGTIKNCIAALREIPLDYSSPEAAIEIVPIDMVLELTI